MKILHVAPINVAGVPYSMMMLHRRFGNESRLVSLHKNTLTFPEDICLNIPLPRNLFAAQWRKLKREGVEATANKVSQRKSVTPDSYLPIHRPKNIFERLYFKYDDWRREPIILQAIEQYGLEDFSIIHYDGGLDFFRDCRIAKRWKKEGKKIVCHYMGSDLRRRGIYPVMDELTDLNLTNESDHLLKHPNINYIYIPFDASEYKIIERENKPLRVIHSPSNRAMKGTELILPVIERLKKIRDVEFILAEKIPHTDLMKIKQSCDIAIEQVGNYGGTGYGRNSLETLAMGIPTITEMTQDYISWLPENPFVLATADTLLERLVELIDNPSQRRELGLKGRAWVEKYHSFESVHKRLMELYKKYQLIAK